MINSNILKTWNEERNIRYDMQKVVLNITKTLRI